MFDNVNCADKGAYYGFDLPNNALYHRTFPRGHLVWDVRLVRPAHLSSGIVHVAIANRSNGSGVSMPNRAGTDSIPCVRVRSGRQSFRPILDVAELPKCPWSLRTALDPKHKPQVPHRPATTVRREWARYPQEAHVLDPAGRRIRRLAAHEIVRLQGFEPDWFDAAGLDRLDSIRAAGDAVPPPVSRALFEALRDSRHWTNPTHVEICAGAGGLASGAMAAGFETLALVDAWAPAGRILKTHWDPSLVHVSDVRKFDFCSYRGRVGILSGGPPCQPWSAGGARRGELDSRDLLGRVDRMIADSRPEAFVFENVPGLVGGAFAEYFEDLMRRLRSPAEGLRYGVLAAILNAADFGVPQIRRRVFIIGLRDATAADVAAVFDRADVAATYRDRTWRTVSDVLDPTVEGWMEWWYPGLPHGV